MPNHPIHKTRLLGSGFKTWEIELYRLLDRPSAECANFMSHRQSHQQFRPSVNRGGQKHALEDKWLMHHITSGLGIPSPVTLGLYHPALGQYPDGTALQRWADFEPLFSNTPRVNWIIKPRGGRQGEAVHHFCGDHSELHALLSSLPDTDRQYYDSAYHGYLIQQCLEQHAEIAAINPTCINSLRVVTFCERSGEVHVDCAIMRLGRGHSAADNWDKGGLSVGIDLDTGQLIRGVTKPKFGGDWFDSHPDSGEPLTGRPVPFFDEARRLCTRAAKAFSGTPSIGWDIALTPNGPVLMEGNAQWDLPMVQVHSTGYLTDDKRRQLKEFGVELQADLLPATSSSLHLAAQTARRSRAGRWWVRRTRSS
ncbi:sugar-transfer associated ATP-grasp domain-containing protein [Thioalkalivibrio sp. ALJ1]|uniref:sugar-transfer associated ATP-grasp domain-containing protein n=1 Tax=Thioalkalivibrio sp. ALJ1 TaxID=1158144 RepID=UPI00068F464E|nr:sugar-transfer associated ATP-grasp domain-containing protein [Thioalkalivibrio sp. ALJ1]